MPTIDDAVEGAIYAFAQSRKDAFGGLPKMPTPDEVAVFAPHMRAAISAFLADVPVSEGMENVGGDVAFTCSDINPDELRGAFKDMCAKLAEEIQ